MNGLHIMNNSLSELFISHVAFSVAALENINFS